MTQWATLTEHDRRIIRSMAGRYANAYPFLNRDDLVQEGMIRASRSLAGHDPDRSPRQALLRRCLHTRFLDMVRSELGRTPGTARSNRFWRETRMDENIPDPCDVDPVREISIREIRDLVMESVGGLSETERSVVALTLEGHPDTYIADQVGCSAPRVSNARKDAVEKLRKRLAMRRAL